MYSWRLVDAEPIAEESKYTFYKASLDEIQRVRPGEVVKLIFAFDSENADAPSAERMWVEVTEKLSENSFRGKLDNDPAYITDIKCGDEVTFQACHIINTEHDRDDNIVQRYLPRCFVTNRILDGDDVPGYIYREKPDVEEDSGWRVLAGDETDEFLDDPRNLVFVSLGAVLNRDDSFLEILNEPEGSAFARDPKTGKFTRLQLGT